MDKKVILITGTNSGFDCENELAAKYGDAAAYQGKQQKCLSC